MFSKVSRFGGRQNIGSSAFLQGIDKRQEHFAGVVEIADAGQHAIGEGADAAQRQGQILTASQAASISRGIADQAQGAPQSFGEGEQSVIFVGEQVLHAQVLVVVVSDFHDDRFNQHLGATHVELIDDRFQGFEHFAFGGDDQRIGGGVGLELGAAAALVAVAIGDVFDDLVEHWSQFGGIGVFEVGDARIADLPRR